MSESASLGEQIKWRRRQLGMRQKDVAELLGVNVWTVGNWEKGVCGPQIEHWPRVIEFLGRDPFRKPRSLGEHILREMRARGLSYKAFAKEIGMSPKTLAKIAKDEYGVIDPRVRFACHALCRKYEIQKI
ncbi:MULTISPECIES: helix-turn-helix transcriptional regulator [Euryhalocaulis]|uniref:helix-turn-helix transcriptional regulator n=1 Tax=Euryhalocaulis TaxID=1712422 RepID=UPI0017C66510|nr:MULTISPECIES: helix-turn-helix transcriptional regulator [Euryhalocaulis]MBA4801372.1 helix-turn-helix domain-containing protein [Euryhalocaulis sp.]